MWQGLKSIWLANWYGMEDNLVVHTWASSAAHLLPLLLHTQQGGGEETGGGDKQTHGRAGVGGLDRRTPLACALARSAMLAENANIEQEGERLENWRTRCRVLRPAPASQSDTDFNPVAWCIPCRVLVHPLPCAYRQFFPRSSGGGGGGGPRG